MTFLTAVGGRGALQAGGWQASYLSDHHRESEDTREIVQALEDDFKERFGVRQPTNGDEGLHSPVVTANVTRERRGRGPGQQRPPFAESGWLGSDGCAVCRKENPLFLRTRKRA